MAEQVNEAGRVAMVSTAAAVGDGTLPEADVVLPAVSPGTPREVTASIQTPPLLQKGKGAVGGPSGLALSITPGAAIGFLVAATPPPLRGCGKEKVAAR